MYDVLTASRNNVRFRAILYGTVQFLKRDCPGRLLWNRFLLIMARNLKPIGHYHKGYHRIKILIGN
jgi:hypothetical protein